MTVIWVTARSVNTKIKNLFSVVQRNPLCYGLLAINHYNMKGILTLLFAAGFSAAALAQDGDKTPFSTKSLANDAINKVVVETSAGGIMVTGRSGEAPRIEVYVHDNHGRELSHNEAQRRIDENYDLSVNVNGHELDAIVKNKHDHMDWNNDGVSISFRIYVPQEVSTDLKTSGGGIDLSDLNGNEDFHTSGGGLHVKNLHGKIHGNTSGGGIEVANCSDDIELKTSGGGIRATDCDGKIDLLTSGGGLELDGLKGTITAHTSGGGIRGGHIDGELITSTSGGGIELSDMSGSLDAHTSAGSLSVEMKHVGKYVKVGSSAGNVRLELPSQQGFDLDMTGDRISNHIASTFKGDWNDRHVNGSVNGGGIPVEVHSNNNVDLRID
jgi:DUF4097 and DUF4098 domain-containing protein YvlB